MIRSLSLSDRPRVDALAAESLAEGFRFGARWHAAIEASSSDAPRQFFLGVFEGDALVAVGGVTSDPYDNEPGLGRVRHVYVARAARRRGFGRRLLASLEAQATVAYSSLRLRTDTERAATFYEALGYVRIDNPNATHRRALRERATLRDTLAGLW